MKATILAVVVQALWRLGRGAVKTGPLAFLCVAAVAANVLGGHELVVLFGGGAVVTLARGLHKRAQAPRPPQGPALLQAVPLLPTTAAAGTAAAVAVPFGLGPLFLFFLKTGAVLFGSGYVLLAFLRADLVERWGWLTEQQLLDAIAAGQVTPGPVFTTATFVGYVLGGVPAAIVATVGIFVPAFAFVALSGPLIPILRRSPTAAAFLDGVVVASLALMAVVTWQLGRSAIVDLPTVALAIVSTALLLRFKINSAWLVLGGGLIGLLVASLG